MSRRTWPFDASWDNGAANAAPPLDIGDLVLAQGWTCSPYRGSLVCYGGGCRGDRAMALANAEVYREPRNLFRFAERHVEGLSGSVRIRCLACALRAHLLLPREETR